MHKITRSSEFYKLPKDIQERLIEGLGDNDVTKKFIRMVGHQLGKFDRADAAPLPKMRKQDADYKQIETLYRKAMEMLRAIEGMSDTAWRRLSCASWITSSPWRGPPTRERGRVEVLDLLGAAGETLDQQTLQHGEKGTIDSADIARVHIISVCFRRYFKADKVSDSEHSKFHSTVKTILRRHSSPKALIKKILPR